MPDAVPGTLAEALAALQSRLPRVAKDKPGQAGQGRYLYADLTDCTEAIMPLLSALGLSFTACPTIWTDRFVLAYQLLHSGGESISGWYPLPATGSPQQIGSAITYGRRYCLCAVTGLAPGGDDDDDDGKSATDAHDEPARQPRNVPDAQLAASGQMTRAQKAEHERLAADTVRDPKRAERSHPRAPDPDDPWAQDAPVDHERAAALRGAALTDPEDKLGSRLESQHKVIERLLGQLHVESRVDRHNYVATLLGLAEVASFNHLTYNQAADAIRLLQAELAKEKADA